MGNKYTQLNDEERVLIAVLLKEGASVRAIARELSRSPSTISRELKRHFPSDRSGTYLWRRAQEKATKRRSECRKRKRLKCAEIEGYVREKLTKRWTPEQIAGRLPTDHPGLTISHEAIYQFIYADAREFIETLPRSGKRRSKRTTRKKRRIQQIPHRTAIEQRSAEANSREEFGHWEVDTAYSLKGKAALLICTERKTRLTKIAKLPAKRSTHVNQSLVSRLAQFPPQARKSLTYDNGTENTQHLKTNQSLGTQSFFCLPYHSWEKGTVENTIGIIRRQLPKATNFDPVTQKQVKQVENWLNSMPRKCLNYSTPLEAFKRECCT